MLDFFKAFNPSFGTLADFYSKLPQQKELIGIYENKWTKAQNWGIATTTYKVDNRDLSVWFRTWSGTEPPRIAKPEFKPDVKIQSVDLPTNARSSYGLFVPYSYSITMDLVNNEAMNIPVRWVIECPSLRSTLFAKEGSLTLTARQNKTVYVGAYYFTASGTITGTIKLYYFDVLIHTWPATVQVAP